MPQWKVLWPYAVLVVGIGSLFSIQSLETGIVCTGLGGGVLAFRWAKFWWLAQAEEAAARAAAEKAQTDAAEKAAREAIEQKRMEEEEHQYQIEQAKEKEASLIRRLHMQVDELVNYASRLKPQDDNRQLKNAMMEVVGQIAGQRDLEARHFSDPDIAADVRLLLEQLKRRSLEDDIVYQRAARVLRYQPPHGPALRAVG